MKKLNILIIEDNTQIREIFGQIFSVNGFEVFLAENGEYGVRMAKKILPDIILCDILMPVMDGYAVKKNLSEDNITKNIPFIFVTSKTELADFKLGMNLGADDYVTKPVNAKELLETVTNRIQRLNSVKHTSAILDKNDNNSHEVKDKLLLKIENIQTLVELNSIVLISAKDYYSIVSLSNKKTAIIKKSLNKWEKILPGNIFFRAHRNSIININYILAVENWFKSTYKIFLMNIEEPIFLSQKFSKIFRANFKIKQ